MNNAIIDFYHRRVTFKPSNKEKFAFKGRSLLNHKMIILFLQEQRMLAIRCMGFLASVVGKRKEKKIDPTEVFPGEISGLPPSREISFEIELLPITGLISKAPYRMALADLKELQTQV